MCARTLETSNLPYCWKILLELLERLGGRAVDEDLRKRLALLSLENKEPSYSFGSLDNELESEALNHDRKSLLISGHLREASSKWILNRSVPEAARSADGDRALVSKMVTLYGSLTTAERLSILEKIPRII